MAQTVISKDDAMAIKKYSAFLAVESPGQSFFMSRLGGDKFIKMGKGDYFSTDGNRPIQILKDLEKDAGEYISYDLIMQIGGSGVTGDDQMQGKEQKLVPHTDGLYINQLRQGVNCGGKMSRRRTKWDMREHARPRLVTWWARAYDEGLVCYLAGTRGEGTAQWMHDIDFAGWAGNAFVAPDTDHLLIGSGKAGENNLAAGDNFCLDDLDEAVYQVKNMADPPVPIIVDGEEMYIYIAHGRAMHHFMTDTTAGNYKDLLKSAGERGKKNPLFRNASFVYKNMIVHEYSKIPEFDNSGSVLIGRNLILGAQSAVVGFGNSGGNFQYSWYEDTEDRGNVQIIGAGSIFGMKKTRFNSKDKGVMVQSVALDEA